MKINLKEVPDTWLQFWIDILVSKKKLDKFNQSVLWSFLDEKLRRAEEEISVSSQLSIW